MIMNVWNKIKQLFSSRENRPEQERQIKKIKKKIRGED